MTSIGMLLFPGITVLDLTGPYEVLSRLPDTQIRLVAAAPEPVVSERGLAIVPDLTFDKSPPFDIVVAPGGNGINQVLEHDGSMRWLQQQGAQARWVTSVCTGSLLLGAAGLLRGYRATTHWLSLDLLSELGATPVSNRVVVDRNRITAAGVSAGIDFALTLAGLLHGQRVAQEIQLMLEYDPAPPFACGSPRTAEPEITESVTTDRRAIQDVRRQKIRDIVARWPLGGDL